MTTLSINSVNSYYQNSYSQSTSSQGQTDFQNLANALQSGNLSAAQNAFTSLQQLLPNLSTQSSAQQGQQSSQTNPLSSDLQSLASALNSGSLSNAQTAFSQLQSALQAMHGHHHHHHGGGGESQAATSTQNSPSPSADSDVGGSVDVTA